METACAPVSAPELPFWHLLLSAISGRRESKRPRQEGG